MDDLDIEERLSTLLQVLSEVRSEIKLFRSELVENLAIRNHSVWDRKTGPEYSDALNTINRLKEIRTLTSYTQAEFGMLLGLSQSLISKIEAGQTAQLSFHRAIELAALIKRQEERHTCVVSS